MWSLVSLVPQSVVSVWFGMVCFQDHDVPSMICKHVDLLIPAVPGLWGDFNVSVKYLTLHPDLDLKSDGGKPELLELFRHPFEEEKRPPRAARVSGTGEGSDFLEEHAHTDPTKWPLVFWRTVCPIPSTAPPTSVLASTV
jgi:hypothetical protein